MGCCGKRRGELATIGSVQGRKARPQEVVSRDQPRRYSVAYFQYLGRTGLSAIGPISGKRYRFDCPGAIVAVDPRDRRSLAGVPNLRQVGQP
jgi:hypothetical protein